MYTELATPHWGFSGPMQADNDDDNYNDLTIPVYTSVTLFNLKLRKLHYCDWLRGDQFLVHC